MFKVAETRCINSEIVNKSYCIHTMEYVSHKNKHLYLTLILKFLQCTVIRKVRYKEVWKFWYQQVTTNQTSDVILNLFYIHGETWIIDTKFIALVFVEWVRAQIGMREMQESESQKDSSIRKAAYMEFRGNIPG